jgi:hypothetical protein
MKRLYSLIIFTALVTVSFTQTAAAFNPLGAACKPVASTSAACSNPNTTNNPITGPNGVLIRVTHIVALAAGSAAVIIIIISGIRFITSQGESDKAAKARQSLINAAIGLVVIVLAQAIITYVIKTVLN